MFMPAVNVMFPALSWLRGLLAGWPAGKREISARLGYTIHGLLGRKRWRVWSLPSRKRRHRIAANLVDGKIKESRKKSEKKPVSDRQMKGRLVPTRCRWRYDIVLALGIPPSGSCPVASAIFRFTHSDGLRLLGAFLYVCVCVSVRIKR